VNDYRNETDSLLRVEYTNSPLSQADRAMAECGVTGILANWDASNLASVQNVAFGANDVTVTFDNANVVTTSYEDNTTANICAAFASAVIPPVVSCEAHNAAYYNVPATFECNGQTVVDNDAEYDAYIASNYGNLSNLKIRGNLTGTVIESPCLITYARETMISAPSLRVDGLKGVHIRKDSGVNISSTDGICITSGAGEVQIGAKTELNALNGDINIHAYLKADINGDSTMTAHKVRFISDTDNVDIGKDTVVNATSFAGESAIETHLRQNYTINATGNITLTGADVVVGKDGTLSADGNIGVNAINSAHFKQDQKVSGTNVHVEVAGDDGVLTVGKDADLTATGSLSLMASGLDSELNLKNDSHLSASSLHGSATTCSVNKKAHWNASSVSGNCITTLSK
jgi:hypothetical protein